MLHTKNRVNKTEMIAWVAGIIDGEGCINIRPNGKNSWAYEVNVVNTSRSLILKLESILKHFGVVFYSGIHKWNKSNWKTRWDVRVIRRSSIKKLLELIIPHLGSKEKVKRSEILLKIIKSKESRPHGYHYYTPMEQGLIRRFRSLQRKPYKRKTTLSQAK